MKAGIRNFMAVCIVLLITATCQAQESQFDRWHSLIVEAKSKLNFQVNTTSKDGKIELQVDMDSQMLSIHMSSLPFSDLRLIIDFHREIGTENTPMPVWAGDRDAYIEQVASFVIDSEYNIINYFAEQYFHRRAAIL